MRLFGTVRFVLSFAVAILVLLTVWIAVRAVGPAEASKAPSVVLPSMPRVTVAPPPSVTVTPSKTASRTPSKSPSLSSSPSKPPRTSAAAAVRTSDPVPEKTSSSPRSSAPTTVVSSSRAPRVEVDATVWVTASWNGGYMASVRVENEGDAAVDWKVTVSHADLQNLQLRGVWNADGNLEGSTVVLTGGRLEPGRSARFGFQTSKTGRGDARPSGCNAVGGSCRVR